MMWSCPKQVVADKVYASTDGTAWAQQLTAWSTGPEHAIGYAAFYIMNIVMPVDVYSLSVPPSTLLNMLYME